MRRKVRSASSVLKITDFRNRHGHQQSDVVLLDDDVPALLPRKVEEILGC